MRTFRVIFAVLLLLSTLRPVRGQDTITALRNAYAGQASFCRVKVAGLHVSFDVLGRPVEVRVANGAIVRGSNLSLRGSKDVPVPPGSIIRVTGISSENNSRNDVLRVDTVAFGAALPIAFLLPKASLSTLPQEQIQQLISTILEPEHSAPTEKAQSLPPIQQNHNPVAAASSQRQQPSPAGQPQRTPLSNDNIDELNAILNRHNGDALTKLGGIRAAMMTPDYTPDNLVIEGVLQPRGQGSYHGMRDVALPPSTHAQFKELRAFTDDQHDYFRLVVRADIGAFAPVTWVVPKGQLASLSKRQIMEMIDPVVVFAAADHDTFSNERQRPNTSEATPSVTWQAPRPPDPGCEWIPYRSTKYGFDLMRERCKGSPPLSDDLRFTVYRKPSEQSLQTAVRQQIILKFNDPQARANCRVVQSNREEHPGWHEFSIEPFGSYAHPKVDKNINMEKSDDGAPCDAWAGANTDSLIIYNPVVTKKMFFVFRGLSDNGDLESDDIFTLRMSEKH